nr:hypothetical protein [uncultured Draconibacterium sp.]
MKKIYDFIMAWLRAENIQNELGLGILIAMFRQTLVIGGLIAAVAYFIYTLL